MFFTILVTRRSPRCSKPSLPMLGSAILPAKIGLKGLPLSFSVTQVPLSSE